MATQILKRDGSLVPFVSEKIAKAIEKALIETNEIPSKSISRMSRFLTEAVCMEIDNSEETPSVERVQDVVEEVLMRENLPKTAKAYILYRADHGAERSRKEELMDALTGKFMEVSLKGKDSVVTKGASGNANVDTEGPMGKMLSYGAETSKMIALEKLVSKEYGSLHKNGDIHIHELIVA